MEPKKITQAGYLWGWYVFEVVLYVHVFPASLITFVAKNFFYTDCVSCVSDILSRRTEHRRSLLCAKSSWQGARYPFRIQASLLIWLKVVKQTREPLGFFVKLRDILRPQRGGTL